MASALPIVDTEEEILVAELELLGIRYLSRQTAYRAERVRRDHILLADIVQQPSARVRAAVIPVLLAHPQMASAVPTAMRELAAQPQLTLKFFYTAAVYIQQLWSEPLRAHQSGSWHWLPDLFSVELGLPSGAAPREQLQRLGREHQRQTGSIVNWAGTYENAARRLLRQWERERLWSP